MHTTHVFQVFQEFYKCFVFLCVFNETIVYQPFYVLFQSILIHCSLSLSSFILHITLDRIYLLLSWTRFQTTGKNKFLKLSNFREFEMNSNIISMHSSDHLQNVKCLSKLYTATMSLLCLGLQFQDFCRYIPCCVFTLYWILISSPTAYHCLHNSKVHGLLLL